MESAHPNRNQQLLTPLRGSITNKPPSISGTLPLPASCFSLFYRTTEDDARFDDPEFLGHRTRLTSAPLTYHRRIDLANATRDGLEQLAEACEPTSSDMNKKAMMDGPAKMDPGSFAPLLVPGQTSLVKVIRDYQFEGDKSSQRLKIDLRELNVYSTHLHRSFCIHSKPSRDSSRLLA